MSKKSKYVPIKHDEVIDLGRMLGQAVSILDKVAVKSIKDADTELMLQVTDRWISIAKIFNVEVEVEEVNTDDQDLYGFGGGRNEVNQDGTEAGDEDNS